MRGDVQMSVAGQTYTVTMFAGTKGLNLFLRLLKVFGEPLVKAIMSGVVVKDGRLQEGQKQELLESAIGSVMGGLLDRIDPAEMDRLVKEVLSNTLVTDSTGNHSLADDFDLRFSGEMKLMWTLFFKSVQAQFSDFTSGFSALGALGTKKPAK